MGSLWFCNAFLRISKLSPRIDSPLESILKNDSNTSPRNNPYHPRIMKNNKALRTHNTWSCKTTINLGIHFYFHSNSHLIESLINQIFESITDKYKYYSKIFILTSNRISRILFTNFWIEVILKFGN